MKTFPNPARVAAAILLVAIALAGLPANARTKFYRYSATKTYEASSGVLSNVGGPDPTCDANHNNCRIASDGSIDIGTVTFPPLGGTGKVVLTITIKDAVNPFGSVSADACQNLNGDTTCGGAGEPAKSACFYPGKGVLLAGVDRSKPTTVFINTVGGCQGPTDIGNTVAGGTTGSVTISTLLPVVAPPKVVAKLAHTFTSTEACAAACSYYVEPSSGAVQDNTKACTAPGPAGSYSDFVVTAPKEANQLFIMQKPTVDWDVVVCAKPPSGNNGSLIAFETSEPNCPTVAVGCKDMITIPVVAGRKYVVRNYNWADPPLSMVTAQIQWRRT